jgi:hypothetical protein
MEAIILPLASTITPSIPNHAVIHFPARILKFQVMALHIIFLITTRFQEAAKLRLYYCHIDCIVNKNKPSFESLDRDYLHGIDFFLTSFRKNNSKELTKDIFCLRKTTRSYLPIYLLITSILSSIKKCNLPSYN